MLGNSLGVEPPGNGFSLLAKDVVLAADDTYYASWTAGESVPYINSEGKEVALYPAQIYLLYFGCKDDSSARNTVNDWITREKETYEVYEEKSVSLNGQTYTILYYNCGSETNPYSNGATAFGVFHHYAVSAELTCTESFSGDAATLLTSFLNGCHYSSSSVR